MMLPTTTDLFAADDESTSVGRVDVLGPGARVLRGFALANDTSLLAALRAVVAAAPLRHMVTPGGLRMSVAMTNCGSLGWVSDRRGYRYDPLDPQTGRPWPPMPASFAQLAARAAAHAGFAGFAADACLVNRYDAGTRLSLHQDRNERDFDAHIVSVSLGIPATFLFGGDTRTERPVRVPLRHGDVVVWGGVDRLRFHGVAPLRASHHAALGPTRINLTMRKAG
jgi:alkylated DNA repair protein (DNA oxidative demethylase)